VGYSWTGSRLYQDREKTSSRQRANYTRIENRYRRTGGRLYQDQCQAVTGQKADFAMSGYRADFIKAKTGKMLYQYREKYI
jgi:hypothetical protein